MLPGPDTNAIAVALIGASRKPTKPPNDSLSGPPFVWSARLTVTLTAGTSSRPGVMVFGCSPAGVPVTFRYPGSTELWTSGTPSDTLRLTIIAL